MRTRSLEQIRRSRRTRPTLEALDGRQLLAILVTSGADSGPGTLRVAIQQNNGTQFGDEIRFQEGIREVVLTSGSLNASKQFRLIGSSSGVTIRRSQTPGTPEFGLFTLKPAQNDSASWRFENLSLIGGAAGVGLGGAISSTDGSVILANCTVADNTAISAAGIFVTRTSTTIPASLSVSNSTFRNNRTVASGTRAAGSGGAIVSNVGAYSITSSLLVGNQATNGGAILGLGSGTLVNSTVVGNTNTFAQGVVSALGGTIDIVGSTITGNQGAPNSSGTGFLVAGVGGVGARLTNTIVAGNIGGDLISTITVGTNNLIGDGTGGLDPATNLRNVDPKLGPLQDNGGPTLSMMPLPGSPAIDAGGTPAIAADVDQRYAARPINDRFDIGAVEVGSDAPSLVVTTDLDTVDPADGLTSLREAIAFGNRLGAPKRITFAPVLFASPRTITLNPILRTLVLANDTEIDGPAAGVTVARSTAAGTPRFGLFSSPTADPIARTTLRRLTLTGGDTGNGSAFQVLASTLILDTCNVIGNRSTGNFGVIGGNTLIASNSSFLNNTSTTSGAIEFLSGTLVNCTFAGNSTGSPAAVIDIFSATLTNCTIVGNTSTSGSGGLRISSGSIRNSIVADNVGGDIGGTATGTGNLIGDGSGGLDPAANLLNVRPNLSALQTDGLTSFFIPLPGSPAREGGITANVPDGVTTDQRGSARFRGVRVDIGSVETDAVSPTVTSIAADVPDGPYGTGRIIPIVLRFSRPVFVDGTPTLSLNSGGAAAFSSGSGTDALTFVYTVRKGDAASKLEAAALSLGAGGVIRDADANPATLTLPAAGAPGSIGAASNIVIDTVAPQVVAFRVLFGSRSFDVLASTRINLPWRITGIQAVFSKPVAAGSAASLAGVTGTSLSGLGTTTLTWTFGAIEQGILRTSLRGTGPGALADAAGNTLADGLGFGRTLRVLAGDANDDGMVSTADVSRILGSTKRPYDIFSDVNGDGVVNILDVNLARSFIGRRL